ncbi:MAG: hypothetical protein ACRENE_25860 [Polyangiaceae bacterium]
MAYPEPFRTNPGTGTPEPNPKPGPAIPTKAPPPETVVEKTRERIPSGPREALERLQRGGGVPSAPGGTPKEGA